MSAKKSEAQLVFSINFNSWIWKIKKALIPLLEFGALYSIF
jgi:hypothetical protein